MSDHNGFLKFFDISVATDNKGSLKGFKIISEIKDGVMVSKDHLFILGSLLQMIANDNSSAYIRGWLIGFLNRNHSAN